MVLQIITDISDASYNEMYGMMRGVADKLSDSHLTIAPIAPAYEFSIVHGAFLTRLLADSYISPTVIFTNVSPHQKYSSDIIGKTKKKDILFIGSNNGIFDWLVRDLGLEYLVKVNIRKPYITGGNLVYLPGENPPKDYASHLGDKTDYLTFSAHSILGPIAVALACGVSYKKFGEVKSKDFIVPLKIEDGEIVHIDNYGNAKIYGSLNFPIGAKLEILVDGATKAKAKYINDRMMSHPTGSFVLYSSTSLPNMTDLALIRGDACGKLKLKIGDLLSYKRRSS